MEVIIDLDEIVDGRFHPDLQANFEKALAEAYNSQAKVGVVVEFVLVPKTIGPDQSEAVNVEVKMTIKHHKEIPQATSLYIRKDKKSGLLSASRKHPDQVNIFELGNVSKLPSRD